MRNIKFRGWDKKTGIMKNVNQLQFPPYTGDNKIWIYLHEFESGYGNEDDIELMQSTGLKDKMGSDIFEGDIVKTALYGQTVGSITFNSGSFCLLFSRPYSPSTEIWSALKGLTMVVIGNIYENPDLLNKNEGA